MLDSITEEEVAEAVMGDPARQGLKIVMAPQDDVVALREHVQSVVTALGHSSAWVSDESMVADFMLDEEDLQRASCDLGVDVCEADYIVELARKVRDSKNGR